MTHQLSATIPAAGPDCATFAPLLPLLAHADQGLLAEAQTASARAHVAGCPHCRAMLAGYERVERALRHLGAEDAAATRHLREEIMEFNEESEQPPASVSSASAVAAPSARLHRLLSPAGAIAAVLLVSVLAAALFAGRAGLFGKAGSHAPGPSETIYADSLSVSGIVPGGSNGTWLLGTYQDAVCFQHLNERAQTPVTPGSSGGVATPDPACAAHPLLLRWDGQQWHRVSVDMGTSRSYSLYWRVSVLPTGEAFATTGSTMVHLRNGTWSVDPAYAFPPEWIGTGGCRCVDIESLDMVSPQEGWAAGSFWTPTGSSDIAHYVNGRWVLQPLPASPSIVVIHGISMASPTEGWAVGYTNTQTLTERYHNGQWTRVDPVQMSGQDAGQLIPGSLNKVQTLPNGDAWAVGELNPSSGPGLILHWVSGAWHVVDTGIHENILHGLDMVSPTEGWVVGDGAEILHLRNGTWTKEFTTIHGFATGAVAMNSTQEGWAFGGPLSSDGTGEAVLHYRDGVWTSTPLATILARALNG